MFVKDLQTGITTRVSTDRAGVQGNNWSDQPAISPDGRLVAFASAATNLVAGDTNGYCNVFVRTVLERPVSLTDDTGTLSIDQVTSNPGLTISGAETGAMIEYSVNGSTTWSTTYTVPTADGEPHGAGPRNGPGRQRRHRLDHLHPGYDRGGPGRGPDQ